MRKSPSGGRNSSTLEVRVVALAAVALLEFVARRVENREGATRVDGFGVDRY